MQDIPGLRRVRDAPSHLGKQLGADHHVLRRDGPCQGRVSHLRRSPCPPRATDAPDSRSWNQNLWQIITTDTSSSCVSINPQDANPAWVDLDDLPENRGMGNMILLPNGKILILNGVGKGSAGYGWDAWALNQSVSFF